MLRTTRADVYAKFKTLCLVSKRKSLEQIPVKARYDWDVEYYGCWHLEFKAKCGYRIEEYSHTKFPMGEQYRGAAEMMRTMGFAIGVLQSAEAEQRRRRA